MNNWLKQRRKLCDEATPGKWLVHDHGVPNNFEVTSRYCTICNVASWSQGNPMSDFTRPNAKYIAAHDPATMRLIYDVVEAAKSTYARQTDAHARWAMQDIGDALEALQNKVGGEDD